MRVPLQKAYQSVCTFVSSEKFQLSLVATVKTYLTFFFTRELSKQATNDVYKQRRGEQPLEDE